MSVIRLTLIGLLLLCSVSIGQSPMPDNMSQLVKRADSTGGQTLGCYTWDPVHQVFLTATFGSSREFRRVDTNTNPPTVTVLAYNSDGTSFALSSDVPGGVTNWDDTGRLNPAGMVINTAPVTVGGITYPPYTLTFVADNGVTVFQGGSTIRRDWSKRFYRWDMREIFAPTSAQPDYNNAQAGDSYHTVIGSYGIADWNDVFSTLATEQGIIDAMLPLEPDGTPTFNIGRQPALSRDCTYLYYNDSASDFGGIWKIHTGTGAISFIYNDRSQSDRINTEPAVLHTSVRDLDPGNPVVGEQIIFEGDGSLNEGGINYLIDTGTAVLGPYVLFTADQLRRWVEWNGPSWDTTGRNRARKYKYNNADPLPADTGMSKPSAIAVRSMWADSQGNIYWNDGSNYSGVWRYDLQGRISLVRSKLQHYLYNFARGFNSTQNSTYRMQTREVTYTGPGGSFPVQQVMFHDNAGDEVGGAYVFKPGDFNRDNVVNEADVTAFMAAMATPTKTVQTITLGASNWSLPVTLAAGSNTIEARSMDRAGNYSAVVTSTVNCAVDSTPPVVAISSPTSGQNISTRAVTVYGTASDPAGPNSGLMSVEVRVNSGAWRTVNGSSSWNVLVGLALGANTIQARSLDISGNYSSLASVNVNCSAPADSTLPTIAVSTPTNGQNVKAWSMIASGTAYDSGSAGGVETVELRVNSGLWLTANTTSNFSSWTCPLAFRAGSNTVEARSKDYAGNYSNVTTITMTSTGLADLSEPTIRITAPLGGEGYAPGPVALTGTANDSGTGASGVALVELRVNGGSWQPASGTTSWTCSITVGLGSNVIEARCRDNAGNYCEANAAVTVLGYGLDTTAPTALIVDPADAQVFSTWSYTVKGTASDLGAFPSGVSLVEARVNGGAWRAAAGRAEWSAAISLVPGSNLVEVRARDYAGNYSSATDSVTVTCADPPGESTIPTITLTEPKGAVSTYAVTVKGTANDADVTRSGVGAVEVRLNGGAWMQAVVLSADNSAGGAAAENTISYYETATDGAGNPLEDATDKTAWANYMKYDMNGNGLVTGKDKLLLWRHLDFAPMDYDRDGDVDMVDFGHFQSCWTGENVRQRELAACGDAQLDGDDDVDLNDLARFMDCASGPKVAADPACMD